jgi:hypothetical protein
MAKEKDFTFDEIDSLINKEFDNLIDFSKVDTSVKTWLDSGVYALNYACSKSLYGAIPVSRITCVDGLSGTGKSLLLASVMKDPKVDYIIIIETEGGGSSKELYEFAGVDMEKVRMLKASTFENYSIKKSDSTIKEVADGKFPKSKETKDYVYVEGVTRMMKKIVNTIRFNGVKKNIVIFLDTLANLQSVRELSGTVDMGKKPQEIARFFRTFDNAFEQTNISFIFANKVYTNIGNEYQPWVVSGGVNVMYNPSLFIRLADTAETDDVSETEMKKEKDRRKTALGSSIKPIRATIEKSRFGTEKRRCNFLIDMAVGPAKYSGLFGLLRDFGVIQKAGGSYYKLEEMWEKTFYKKDFIAKIRENEKENIAKLQELLEAREIEIMAQKKDLQLTIDEDIDSDMEDSDSEIGEGDLDDMKKAMIRDMEK